MFYNVDTFIQNSSSLYSQQNNTNNYNSYIYNDYKSNNGVNQDTVWNSKFFECLFSIPEMTKDDKDDKKEIKQKQTLFDFVKQNLDKVKEDLIYYFSSPESLSHFKNDSNQEIKYEFYKDLNFQNFMDFQKERFKLILSISESDLNSSMKISKLSNYNNSFCSKVSIIQNKEQNNKALINVNLIENKMNSYPLLYSEKEKDDNKIISYLNELKYIFELNNINMESLGIIFFNSIEKNLIFLLKLIENKLILKKSSKNLTDFSLICLDILKCFKSTKLYFYIIYLLKQYKDILEFNQLNLVKDIIQFIPNNCFDFNQLDKNIQKVLINDLRNPLINKNIVKNISNEISINADEYKTINYDNYLLIFFDSQNILKDINKERCLFYYKIDLINKNIIHFDKLNLFNENKDNIQNKTIKDLNISIKDEYIFIFYIICDSTEYILKYKIYNKYSLILLKEDIIELMKNFIPNTLFNDNKYLYCTSNGGQILMIKRNLSLDYIRYIHCSFRLFEKDMAYYQEIKDLLEFHMYNSLNINNLILLNNSITKKKFIAKLIINNDNNIFNIYEMKDNSEKNDSLKIAYNDNKFIITKIRQNSLIYDITSADFNNLIDKGILLLPFNSKISNNKSSVNLYEYLIQEYSSILNLCGNFELINAEKETILIKFPFSFCCNFDSNILNFIIENIIENNKIDCTKLNYIIILKQIICSLYNVEIFEEESINRIIPYFKK